MLRLRCPTRVERDVTEDSCLTDWHADRRTSLGAPVMLAGCQSRPAAGEADDLKALARLPRRLMVAGTGAMRLQLTFETDLWHERPAVEAGGLFDEDIEVFTGMAVQFLVSSR